MWVKNKEWKHLGIAAGITIISAIIGIAGNALTLKTTSEYAKYTMRGGKDINIQGDSCLLYTSPSPRDRTRSRMPSSA